LPNRIFKIFSNDSGNLGVQNFPDFFNEASLITDYNTPVTYNLYSTIDFSEHEILREEIFSLQAVKSRFKLRITELEDEIKKLKEELEKTNKKLNPEDDVCVIVISSSKRSLFA
jgi:uncharacterized small protein (DUF1192 family)